MSERALRAKMPTSFPPSQPEDASLQSSFSLQRSGRLKSSWQSLWIAAVFAIVLGATRAIELGDTRLYAQQIADHLSKTPFGTGNSLWEFGHLLWRPLGWALVSLTSPLLSAATGWTPFMQASFVLIAISMLCAIATVVLLYSIVVDVTGSPVLAFVVTLAMAFSHGFLLYAHSGCSYIPGLLCITASLYGLKSKKLAAGAVCYSLATVLWLPFILAGAALLLLAACPLAQWNASLKDNLRAIDSRRAIRFIAIFAAVVVLIFGLAMAARHISTVQEAKDWYSESSHGWSQSVRVARIVTGLPRSFLYLGKDGVLFRRYFRHDLYAPVSFSTLIKASLWKIVAFDLFVVSLLYELLPRSRSGWPLLLLLIGASPVVLFAVFLFEPGSPERYLPALPLLALATAWVLRSFLATRRATQVVIAAFLLCTVLSNGYSFAAPRVGAEDEESWRRISALRSRFSGSGVAMLATNQDKIEEFVSRSLFGPVNRPDPFPIYDLVEASTLRTLQWRQQFALEALRNWRTGGEVWISKRVWNLRPQPEWDWVEGDDPRVAWRELPQFFNTINTDGDSGGPDGFLRLTHNQSNLNLLMPLAAAYQPRLSLAPSRN